MRAVNYFTISILLISTTGCMTMRPLEDPRSLSDHVKVGDKVEVIETSGHINTFTVGKIDDQVIAGNDEHGSLVTIPIGSVERVSVEKVDGGRTSLAVAGGIVAIPIVLLGLGLGAMAAACDAGSC